MKNLKNLVWINLISLLVFIFVLLGVLFNFGFSKIDFIINSLMFNIKSNFLINFSIAISFIFDIKSMIIIFLILSAYLWIKISKRDSIFFMLTIGLNEMIIIFIKNLIQKTRPLNALVFENNFAFPSNHASVGVVFFGFLIYLISKKRLNKNLKFISLFISVFMIFLICFARIYLNVHWFSDVLGGIAIGVFILTSSLLFKEICKKNRIC